MFELKRLKTCDSDDDITSIKRKAYETDKMTQYYNDFYLLKFFLKKSESLTTDYTLLWHFSITTTE